MPILACYLIHFHLADKAEKATRLKLEQGWMIQCPAAFWRTRSWMSAFFDPNSFMASLLSVGWKMFCSWFRTQPGFPSPDANEIPRELIPDPVPAISSCFGAGADFDLLSQFARLTLF